MAFAGLQWFLPLSHRVALWFCQRFPALPDWVLSRLPSWKLSFLLLLFFTRFLIHDCCTSFQKRLSSGNSQLWLNLHRLQAVLYLPSFLIGNQGQVALLELAGLLSLRYPLLKMKRSCVVTGKRPRISSFVMGWLSDHSLGYCRFRAEAQLPNIACSHWSQGSNVITWTQQ